MATLNKAAVVLMMTAILSVTASADIDLSLKAMLETAVKSGDPLQIAAIEKIAIATWPKDADAIKAMIVELKAPTTPSEVAEVKIVAQDAVQKEDKATKVKAINYYLNPALWNGQLELGGGTSSGNTSEQGMTVGLSFRRTFGENWEHDLDSNFDYAKSLGLVTKRKIIGAYKILLKPWDRFYAMNFLEVEADKFSGYKYRITENIGFGYEIINKSNMLWRLEGGPGIRYNKLYITGIGETEFLGRLSNTFEMDLWKNIKLSNKTSVVFTDASTTYDNKAQLSARINAHLAANLSFSVKHDTGAPIGAGGVALPPEPTGARPASVCGPNGSHKTECLRTIPPRENGGNMDVKQMVKGTTLLLPCFIDGCGFFIGDVHYAQGDGEVAGTAIETGAIVTVTTEIRKGMASLVKQPMFEGGSQIKSLQPDRFHAVVGYPLKNAGEILKE